MKFVKMSLSQKQFEELRQLWSDPQFVGSFSGASIFQKALKSAGYNISYPKVTEVLYSIPAYIDKVRRLQIHKTRPYRVDGVNLLWEIDNAIMSKNSFFNGFLLAIDVGSRRIFTRRWRKHNINKMTSLLEDIFHENLNQIPNRMQSDQEFKHAKTWFKKKGIYFRYLTRRNKASLAEYYIYKVKRRLYAYMAHNNTKKWWNYLEQATQNINDTPKDVLGGLKPSSILSPLDDVRIRKANPNKPTLIPPKVAKNNQESYEKKKNRYKVGDLVLYDFKSKAPAFEKSYERKVISLFLFGKVNKHPCFKHFAI